MMLSSNENGTLKYEGLMKYDLSDFEYFGSENFQIIFVIFFLSKNFVTHREQLCSHFFSMSAN